MKTEPRSNRLQNSYFRQKMALLLAFLLLGCGHAAKTATAPDEAKTAGPFPAPAPLERDANDAARFIAGLPGNPGSPFAALEKQDAWQEHRAELDSMWSKTENQGLAAMRTFQAKELSADSIKRSVLFYPFSGPDALMMNMFFPSNSIYVMVGLEPPGSLPTVKQFSKKKDLAKLYGAERNSVNDVLGRSFFITQYMDRQFRGQVTDGLFEPIVHLLVRTNHTIRGFRYVRLDEGGQVVERTLLSPAADRKVPNRGIEVDFTDNSTQAVHRLFYFSINISDKKLADDSAFSAFVNQLKGMTTYLKATSYMTHLPDFSIIRNLILTNSSAVLQDDSGLPYHLYTDPPWHVQLYGDYVKPIRPFGWLQEKDLQEAYRTSDPKPLNFHIGYGLARLPSNLLLAKKSEVIAKN